MISAGNFHRSLMSVSVFIGGSLLISVQPAQANHGNNNRTEFRSFRQQNPDMGRHELRKMFNAERRGTSTSGAAGPDPNTIMFYPALVTNTESVPTAAHIRNNSQQTTNNGSLIRLNSGINLDLSSGNRNITLGENLFSSNTDAVTITVGGQSKTVNAGSQVTAAEYVAAKQVLSGGGQQVMIDASGAAVGGQVDLGALTTDGDRMRATSLVVANNVTTYGDFGKHSDFRLSGDLTNFGTVHALSSDVNTRHGVIGARDINNHVGASISSDVDLTLDASRNINNDGTITSSGSLTLSAGGAINNHGTVSAASDLNLVAPGELTVNNEGGTLSAANAINVRSADYTGSSKSTITGGDLLSRDLNLYSGQGLIRVAVNDLTGRVNETGNAAQVLANTENLTIGDVCLTGDPTFFNSGGSISITGNLSFPENIVIAASGDIVSNGAAPLTIAAGNNSTGFDITMIAGAEIAVLGGADSTTLPGTGNPGDIELSGKASKSGGSIILGGNGFSVDVLARNNPYSGNGNGGNVSLFAFAGKSSNSGQIDVSNAVIGAQGSGTGGNGNIVLVAGGADDAIKTGQLNTTGGSGAGGNVQVSTSQPVSNDKKTVVIYASNGLHAGADLVASTKLTKGADIDIDNGVGSFNVSGNATVFAGGDIRINNAGLVAAGSLSLSAGGDISTNGGGSIRGSALALTAGGDIGDNSNAVTIDTSHLVNLTAGSNANVADLNNQDPGTLLVDFASAPSVKIDAAGRVFSFDRIFGQRDFTLDAKSAGSFNLIQGFKSSIKITTTDVAAAPFDVFVFAGVQSLELNIASGIGTSAGNPFATFDIPDLILSTDNSKIIFAGNAGKKNETFTIPNAGAAVITSLGGLTIGAANITNGDFAAVTSGKKLTIAGDITATNSIGLQSTDVKKGTIQFESGVTLATNAAVKTNGQILIQVGTGGAPLDNPGPFPNIIITETGTGQVVINGPGVSASSSNNHLTAINTTLTINNGLKEKNIIFDGGVTITADPPVEAGDQTFTTVGPTVYKHVGQNLVSAIGVLLDAPPVVSAANSSLSSQAVPLVTPSTDSGVNMFTVNNATFAATNAESNEDDSVLMVWPMKRKLAPKTAWVFRTR